MQNTETLRVIGLEEKIKQYALTYAYTKTSTRNGYRTRVYPFQCPPGPELSDTQKCEHYGRGGVRLLGALYTCLHLRTPFRTVQRHRSAPIRVLCEPVRYINLLVVVVGLVVPATPKVHWPK